MSNVSKVLGTIALGGALVKERRTQFLHARYVDLLVGNRSEWVQLDIHYCPALKEIVKPWRFSASTLSRFQALPVLILIDRRSHIFNLVM